MAFTLDTSGIVHMTSDSVVPAYIWSDLTPFAQGYVEAMFAGPITVGSGAHTYNSVLQLAFSDLAPATLSRIMGDCEAYAGGNDASDGPVFWNLQQDGLLSRFPPLAPYLGEDGLIYLREVSQ